MSEKGWIQSLSQEEEKDPTSPQQTKPKQPAGIISGLAAPEPAAQEPSIINELGKGLAHGVVGLAEAVGTGIEYAGGKLGDQELVDFGDNIQQYWKEANTRFEADPSLQGSVVESPELMTKGAWWAYNTGTVVPSIAASFIPGAATHKAITIGGRAMKWTPALVTKLARLGSALAGGAVGGGLEGANTYEEVLARGGTREEAESAAEKMTLAAGALNAISVDRWLKALPDNIKGRLIARGVRGLTEGITEWLEEPAEALIKMNAAGKEGSKIEYTPEDAIKQIKDGLNVLGPSAVVGMFFPGAGKLGGEYAERTEQPPTGPMSAAAASVKGKLMPLDQEAAMRRAQTLTQQGVPHGVVPHPQAPGRFGVVPIDQDLLAAQGGAEEGVEDTGIEIASDSVAAEMADDHRRNLALRTAIEHMNPEERGAAIEELRQMALTSRLTGLRNKDAFAEMFGEGFDADGRPPYIMQIDSDSLKTVNDLMGHQNGDALLRATGIAIAEELQDLGESDIDAFHFSGDEFGLTGSDPALMEQVAKGAQERLKQAILYGKTPDGRDVELHGLGFSYGVSGSLEESEHALARNKAEREVTGERAPRGERPAGLRFPGRPESAGEGGVAAEEGEADQLTSETADWGRVLASKKADLSEEAIKLLSEERPTRETKKPDTGKAVSLAKIGDAKERFNNFANDLYKDDRVFTNPITGSAVVMREGGTRDDFADVAVRPWQDGVLLDSIITLEHGRGNASSGLDKVIEMADRHNLPVYLTAQPFGTNQGMTKAQLKSWYRSRGFRATGGDEMKRDPGGLSNKKTQGEAKRIEQLKKAKPKKVAAKKEAARTRKLAPSVQPGRSREIVEQAAAQAAHSPKNAKSLPTKGQKSAGNYQKGHFRLHGAEMAIENPKGSVRTGVDSRGKRWSQEIKHHYGYIKRTTGKDGDQLDFFMGPNPDSKIAFVVDQKKPSGQFDEHKAMLGFQSEEEAKRAYNANYEKGWKGMKDITPMPIDKFMEWKDQYTHKEAAKAGPKFMFSQETIRSLNASAERRKMLEIAENSDAANDYFDQQMEEHDFYDDWQSDSSPETGFLPDDVINDIAEQTFDREGLIDDYIEQQDVIDQFSIEASGEGFDIWFNGDGTGDAKLVNDGYDTEEAAQEDLDVQMKSHFEDSDITTLEMLREMDRVDEVEYDVSDLEGVWDEIEYFFTDASQYSGPTVAVYRDTDYGFMVIADNGNSIDEIELTRVAESDVADYIDSDSAESRYKQLIEEELGDDWSVDEMYDGLAIISGTVEGYAASIIETKDGGYSGELFVPGEEDPRQVDGYSMDDILSGLQSEAEDAGDRSTITMQYRDIDGDVVENEIVYSRDDDGEIEIVSINEDEDVESQVFGEAELERIKTYIATEGRVGQFAKHSRRKVKGAKDYQVVVDRAVETAMKAAEVFGSMPSQKRTAVFTERDRLLREVFARQFGMTGENPRIDAMIDALGRPGNEMPDGDLLHLAAPWGEEIPGGHDPIQVEIDHNLDEDRIELYDVGSGKLVAEFSLDDISVATANAALELLDGRAEVPPVSKEMAAERVSEAKSKLDNAIRQFDTQSLETYAKQLANTMYSGSTQEFIADKANGIIEEARRQIQLMVRSNVFKAAEMLSKAERLLAEIDKPGLAISRSNMAGWGRRDTPLSYFFPHFGDMTVLSEEELAKARDVQKLYVEADKLLEAAGYYSKPAEGWREVDEGPIGTYRNVADKIIFGSIMRNARAGSAASAKEFAEATSKMMSKQYADVAPSINQEGDAIWRVPTNSVDLANIIVEAIPAPDTGSPLVNADFSTKLAYTEDAINVIVKGGRNLLVDAINAIGRTVPGAGSFEGEISPNTITQVLQNIVKEAGRTIHAREQADLLALSNMFLFHQQAVPWLRFDPSITIDTIPEGEVFHRGVAIELKAKPDSATLQSLYSGIRGVMPGTEFTVIGNKLVAINFRDGETNTPYSGIDDKVFADAIHKYVDGLDVAAGFIDDVVAEGAYHDISFLGGNWADPEAAKNILAKEISNRGGLGLVKRLRSWEREIAAITAKHEAAIKGEGFALGAITPESFTPRVKPAPKKTVKAYKLFQLKRSQPGRLFPLFIDKNRAVPTGQWLDAKFTPTKGYAERPGWHFGSFPFAPHLLGKTDGMMPADRVWAEVEIAADRDWQAEAERQGGDIKGEIPVDGYYTYPRPMSQGKEWKIAGAMKVNRILSDEEVATLLGKEGLEAPQRRGGPINLQEWGIGTAKGSMSASPVITEGVELSRWPEGGGNGPVAIRLGKARITGKIEDGAILVKMVTGTDNTEIDIVLRDLLRKAADDKVGTIVIPHTFARKKSEFLATIMSMMQMGTLTEVDNGGFYGRDVVELKIGEHIPQPSGTGISTEYAEYLVGISSQFLDYDPDSWSVPKTTDPEAVTEKELQRYNNLFRYPRHSGVEILGSQKIWVDAQIPNIDQQRVLVGVMEDLEAAGFPSFTDMGIDAVGAALFEMDGMNGVYIPSQNRTYLSSKLVDAALVLENPSALQYLTEYLAHEASHFIDYRGTNESLSFFSPLFEFNPMMFNIQSETNATLTEDAGDVIRELFNFYNDRAKDIGVHEMLNYPFNTMPQLYEYGEQLAMAARLQQIGLIGEQEFDAVQMRYFMQQDFIITEAFAQLSAMYYTHRSMVERELPNSFKFMEAIRDASNRLATEGDGPLRAVFSAPNTAAIPAVNVAGGAAAQSPRGPGEGRASAGVGAGAAYRQPGGRATPATQAQRGGQKAAAPVAPRWSLRGSEIWSGLAEKQGLDLKQVGDKLRGMKEEDFYDAPPAGIEDMMDGLDFDELSIMAESAKKLGSTDPIMLEVMRVDAGRETRLMSYEREALAEYVKFHDVAIQDRSPNRENIVSIAVSPTRSGGTVTVGSTDIYNEHPDHWVRVYGPEKEDGSGQDLMWERKYDSPEDATLAYLLLKNAYQPRITIPDASQATTMSLEDYVADTTGEEAKLRSSQHREAAREYLKTHIKAWENYYKVQEKAQAVIDQYNKEHRLFGESAVTIDTLEEDVLLDDGSLDAIGLKEALAEAAGAFELVVSTNIPEFMDSDYPDLKREAAKAKMKFLGAQKSRAFRSRKQRSDLIEAADYNTQFIPSINSDERMHWNVSDHQGQDDNKASLSGEEPVTDTGRQGKIADATQSGWRHLYSRYQQQAAKALDWMGEKFAWASPMGAGMKDMEQYMAKRGLAAGRIGKVNQVVKRMSSILKNVTPEEMPAVFEYLTTAGATAQNLPSRMVKIKRIRGTGMLFRQPKEVNLAKEIVAMKRLIRSIGRRLVERGLIPPMSYEHFKDAYLPRIYLAHILDESTFRALGSGRKVSQLGYTKMRDEGMPELERIIMGEIKDAAYLAPKTVGTTLRDMAILDFIEEVSRNDNWVLPQVMVPYNGKRVSAYWLESEANAIMQRLEYMSPADAKIAEARASDMQKLAQSAIGKASEVSNTYAGYTQVPNTPRYGVMRGMFVKDAIYNDIIGSMQTTVDQSYAGRLLDQGGLATKLTQMWKTSKVAANPPSQIRNFTSNMILLQLSGVPMHKIPGLMVETVKEIRNNGKYWRLAQKHGITESTFAASELWRLERSLLELKPGTHPLDTIALSAGKAVDAMGDAYQFSEALGKTMVMKYFMEHEGYTAEQAAAHANKWLFDYSHVPATVRYLRNAPVGVPFITFYYKALPRMLEAAIKTPHRFTPYIAIPYIISQALAKAYDVDDDDLEKLKKALPMWIQERGHALIIPWKDGHGRWQAFDYGYYLPWGMYWDAIKDVAGGEMGDFIKTTGIFGGPIPEIISAIKTGQDSFTGRPIYHDADPAGQQAWDIFNYTWRLAMPTWLTDIGAASHIYRSITGKVNPKTGEPMLTMPQATLRMFGANVYPIDPEYTRAKNMQYMAYDIKDTQQRLRSMLMDQNLSQKQRENIRDQYFELMKHRAEELAKYREESEIHPNLRTK